MNVLRAFKRLDAKAARHGYAFTTLDAIKLFAIVNMTIDHVGAFFFPDELWWRAIGRITFPVWFFLVGFSRSRGLSRELIIYAIVLTLLQPFVYNAALPLNALVSVILCRLALDMIPTAWLRSYSLELVSASMFLSVFTMPLFEYGTVAFMYALIGWGVREETKPKNFYLAGIFSLVVFLVWQHVVFTFNDLQSAYVIIGSALVTLGLMKLTIKPLIADSRRLMALWLLTILSRNTMPYYFYHRAGFQIAAAWMGITPAAPFHWTND